MHRKLLLLAVVTVTSYGSGCCMCDSSYDYCGPTFLGGPCEECVTDARMNSVFTPHPGPLGPEVIHDGAVPQSVLQPTGEAGDYPMGPLPGGEPPVQTAPPAPRGLPPGTTQGPRARSVSVER